jgi:AmiR/NasT family two-component response regulator
MIRRVKERGNLAPNELVDTALDIIGPLEVNDQTQQELVTMAEQEGNLDWSDKDMVKSEQRVADMLALIAASREYQFE